MPINYQGVQLVSTLTLAATGQSGDSAFVYPAQSSCPFRNLSIVVVPAESSSPYMTTVYEDGELAEAHTFPDPNDRMVCHISYPDFIFPANVGTHSIPKFFAHNEADYPGIPISLCIYNYSATPKSFLVYCCFEAMEGARFGVVEVSTP